MNRLLGIGFEPVGHWVLKGSELAFELSRHASQKNILYAFVSDGEVMYVGKTVRSLLTRMRGYKNPGPSQTTNVRNNARIKSLLRSGAAVDILALPDNGLLHYGQFHVNLAGGLEDSVIEVIAPQWNRCATAPGTGSPAEGLEHSAAEPCSEVGPMSGTSAVPEQMTNSESPRPIASFRLVLHHTYYEQAFFNVGVRDEHLFGRNGQKIDIFCGASEQPIIGSINRTANTNNTPRIMGRKGLKDWFKRNMRPMQEATVTVLSPTAIRLEPRARDGA
jgi:hypothetical protein